MSYEHDLFISYRREPPVRDWVLNHFYPEIQNWLPLELNRPATFFIDETLKPGTVWPLGLQQKLLRSRCLLAVWSPDYFWHEWCVAEWQSMRAREEKLGLATAANPQGIVLPVLFHDGKNFPVGAQTTEHGDFRDYNIHAPVFKDTPKYVDFIEHVKAFCVDIAGTVETVPEWQADWPVLLPPPYNRPKVEQGRL